MITKSTVLKNHSGLHARPASDFVNLAKSFGSNIQIRNLDAEDAGPINAKSIIRILAAGLAVGTHVEISADGADEQAAVEHLVDLIDSGFGE